MECAHSAAVDRTRRRRSPRARLPRLHRSLRARLPGRAPGRPHRGARRGRKRMHCHRGASRASDRSCGRPLEARAPAGAHRRGRMRVAGAPISWGVSELPGWGHRMPPARVLREMRELGLDATEAGPPGYLPGEPGALRELLDSVSLRLVAGFLAVVLHDSHLRALALAEVERTAATLAASGAGEVILAAGLPGGSYDRSGRLAKEGWVALAASLAAAEELTAAHGIGLAFHPHFGTAVASEEEVTMLLETTNVALCLDTAQVARDAGPRVRHVHMKDVDAELAARVSFGELAYAAAVRSGLYRPLGQGDVDLEAVFGRLQGSGYQGWYVLEQDMALTAEPEPASGPVAAARQSLEFFRALSAKQTTNASRKCGGEGEI